MSIFLSVLLNNNGTIIKVASVPVINPLIIVILKPWNMCDPMVVPIAVGINAVIVAAAVKLLEEILLILLQIRLFLLPFLFLPFFLIK